VQLRDDTIALLADKVAAKQAELEAEMARVAALNAGQKIQDKPKAAVKLRGPGGDEWSGRGSRPP
jgi:hypothetical protein